MIVQRPPRRTIQAARAALPEARYKATIHYEATAITSIAVITEGSAGLAGSGSGAKEEPKKDEAAKPRGFGLGSLKPTASQGQQSTQVSASGGARGLGADRAAKGGSNPALVRVTVTPAEVDAFRKGIA